MVSSCTLEITEKNSGKVLPFNDENGNSIKGLKASVCTGLDRRLYRIKGLIKKRTGGCQYCRHVDSISNSYQLQEKTIIKIFELWLLNGRSVFNLICYTSVGKVKIKKCKCGKQASSKLVVDNEFLCRPCYKVYKETPGAIAIELSKIKKIKSANAKAKRARKKQGNINPIGQFEYDTQEFRDKQKTLPARQKYLRENPTPAEVHVKALFESQTKYKPVFQRGFIAYDYYCIVDFYLPTIGMCIEIDGGYHNTPEQTTKDTYRDNYLKTSRSCLVVRITNEDALNIKTFEELSKLLNLEVLSVIKEDTCVGDQKIFGRYINTGVLSM